MTLMETTCTCPKCIKLCRHCPGWPTPEEAAKLLDLGLAPRLMRDWWVRMEGDIDIICPASLGNEGDSAPDIDFIDMLCGTTKGQCTFLTENGLCEIHSSGAKPDECRTASGCQEQDTDGEHKRVADLWDTDLGRAVVARWKHLTDN